jgi:polar amino acid transport system substrate-binding protein
MLAMALALGAIGLAGCSKRSPDVLRVGMELAYPPFEMSDAAGNPAGVSVDLARALGDRLRKRIEIVNMPFDGLIPALKTGGIDLVLSSMTATEERSRSIDFSEPYLKTGLCLLAGINAPVTGPDDLDREGRAVAVKKGTTGALYAQSALRHAKLLVLDQESACVLEVTQGKADAFIYDQMSVYRHWKKNGSTTRALLDPIREESWAIGVRKGRPELLSEINHFLAAYRAEGGFDRLGAEHLPDLKADFAAMGIPFIF